MSYVEKVKARALRDNTGGTWWVLFREGQIRQPLAFLDNLEMADLLESIRAQS